MLIEKIEKLINENHSRKDELQKHLDDLKSLNNESKPERILGVWARARRCYCECVNEPLIPETFIETGAKLLQALSVLRDIKKV